MYRTASSAVALRYSDTPVSVRYRDVRRKTQDGQDRTVFIWEKEGD
jgi:hypothetical protein